MSTRGVARAVHAMQAIEALIARFEADTGEAFAPAHDRPFRDYLTAEVAPLMTAAERARYEGYLRFYYEDQLGMPAESAPTLARQPLAAGEVALSTEMAYERRASALIAAYERETGRAFDPDDGRFAEYMADRLQRVGRSTRRSYQAAIHYHYRVILGRTEGAPDFREGLCADDRENPPARRRTQKGIRPDHLDRIVAHLSRQSAFHPQLAAQTLQASVLCGLRPREWIEARLDTVVDDQSGERQTALVVVNAKSSHGRAHSPTRTLRFAPGEDTPDRIALIDRTILAWGYYVDRFALEYDEQPNEAERERAISAILTATGRIVRRATRALRLPDYTLYSARHQFAANAKAAGLTRVEVAALMGHASPETAGEHYGKRRRGSSGGLVVRPSPADIAAVEARVSATLEQRLARIRPPEDRSKSTLGL